MRGFHQRDLERAVLMVAVRGYLYILLATELPNSPNMVSELNTLTVSDENTRHKMGFLDANMTSLLVMKLAAAVGGSRPAGK